MLMLDHFDRQPGGRVLWDPVGDIPCASWAVEADSSSDRQAMEHALRAGWPVIFRAGDGTREQLSQQVTWLTRKCRKLGAGLFLSEAHLVMHQGRPNEDVLTAQRLARHDGVSVVMDSQDPQTMDKSAMRVGAPWIYLFNVPMSESWFKEYGIPLEAVAAVRAAGKHHYVEIAPNKQISAPKKLDTARLSRFAA